MSRAVVAGSVPAIAGFVAGLVALIGVTGTARAQPVTFDYTVYATSGPWSYSPGLVNPSYSYNTQGIILNRSLNGFTQFAVQEVNAAGQFDPLTGPVAYFG